MGFSSNRAFIQFAGFTFGMTQSFYDFYSQSATSFFGGMINPASDTGDAGEFVFGAYTAQFGNGLSATLALENPRTTAVLNGGRTTMFVVPPHDGSASSAGNLGMRLPVGGSEPVAGYRGQPASRPDLGLCPGHGRDPQRPPPPTTASSDTSGHPSDRLAGRSARA